MNQFQIKRLKIFSLLFFVLSSFVYFLLNTFSNNITFFLKPSELEEKIMNCKECGDNLTHEFQKLRLGGVVKKGSLKYNTEKNVYEFSIIDYDSELKVIYSGMLPSLFREEQSIVILGSLKSKKKLYLKQRIILSECCEFEAQEVLAKHDENYKPIEYSNLENSTIKKDRKIIE